MNLQLRKYFEYLFSIIFHIKEIGLSQIQLNEILIVLQILEIVKGKGQYKMLLHYIFPRLSDWRFLYFWRFLSSPGSSGLSINSTQIITVKYSDQVGQVRKVLQVTKVAFVQSQNHKVFILFYYIIRIFNSFYGNMELK